MAKLLSSMIASLDGCVADERGESGWAEPDEEVHRFAAGVVYLRYGVTPPATWSPRRPVAASAPAAPR